MFFSRTLHLVLAACALSAAANADPVFNQGQIAFPEPQFDQIVISSTLTDFVADSLAATVVAREPERLLYVRRGLAAVVLSSTRATLRVNTPKSVTTTNFNQEKKPCIARFV